MSRGRTSLLASCALVATACDRWFPEKPTVLCADEPTWSTPMTAGSLLNRGAIAEQDGVLYTSAAGGQFELGGEVFADGDTSVVAALSGLDGSVLWSQARTFDDFANASDVALTADGALYTADGTDAALTLWRLDASDGATVWSQPTADERLYALAADEGLVVTASWGDRIVAYDAMTGEERWVNTSIQETHLGQSIAFTGDGDVAVAQWWADRVARPSLWVFSRDTGEPLWWYGEQSYGVEVVAAGDGDVILAVHRTADISQEATSIESEIVRLGPDGAVRWSRSLAPTSLPLDLEVDGEVVTVVGSGRMWDGLELEENCSYVARLSAADGSDQLLQAYCYCTGGAFMGSAAAADSRGSVYVMTSDGQEGIIARFEPH